jgi:hypothetical protein
MAREMTRRWISEVPSKIVKFCLARFEVALRSRGAKNIGFREL